HAVGQPHAGHGASLELGEERGCDGAQVLDELALRRARRGVHDLLRVAHRDPAHLERAHPASGFCAAPSSPPEVKKDSWPFASRTAMRTVPSRRGVHRGWTYESCSSTKLALPSVAKVMTSSSPDRVSSTGSG